MDLWKTILFSASFVINMRIVNIFCSSKEKVLRHYVNFIVNVFAESFEIALDGVRARAAGARGEGVAVF